MVTPWESAAAHTAQGGPTHGSGWPCDRHSGQSALHLACLGGYVQTAAVLLAAAPKSGQLTYRDAQGATPLMTAATAGLPPETLDALLSLFGEYGLDVSRTIAALELRLPTGSSDDCAGRSTRGAGSLAAQPSGCWCAGRTGSRAPRRTRSRRCCATAPTRRSPRRRPTRRTSGEHNRLQTTLSHTAVFSHGCVCRYAGEYGRPPLLAALYNWDFDLLALLAGAYGGLRPLPTDWEGPPQSAAAVALDEKLRSMVAESDTEPEPEEEEEVPEYVVESQTRVAEMDAEVRPHPSWPHDLDASVFVVEAAGLKLEWSLWCRLRGASRARRRPVRCSALRGTSWGWPRRRHSPASIRMAQGRWTKAS